MQVTVGFGEDLILTFVQSLPYQNREIAALTFQRSSAMRCPWFATVFWLPNISDLLDHPFQRYSLLPLDGHEVLAKSRIINILKLVVAELGPSRTETSPAGRLHLKVDAAGSARPVTRPTTHFIEHLLNALFEFFRHFFISQLSISLS